MGIETARCMEDHVVVGVLDEELRGGVDLDGGHVGLGVDGFVLERKDGLGIGDEDRAGPVGGAWGEHGDLPVGLLEEVARDGEDLRHVG